jgi:hypothetical protein
MLNIKESLFSDIKSYCKLNNVEDINDFINRIIEIGFNIEKYGAAPNIPTSFPVEIKKEDPPIIAPVETEKKPDLPKYKKVNLNDDYKIYDI